MTLLIWGTGFTAYGQPLSSEVDSLTNSTLNYYVKKAKERKAFQYLMTQRQETNFWPQLDTTNGDYVFIVEYFNYLDNSSTSYMEFFSAGDSLPSIIFSDGQLKPVNEFYTSPFGRENKRIKENELLKPKLRLFRQFKPYQELAYQKKQVRVHGCVDIDRDGKKFLKIRTKRLQNTYALYTFIDQQAKQVKVSLQYAPKHPKFKIVNYNPVWDF